MPDKDDAILGILKEAKRKNKDSLSIDTITFNTGLRREEVCKRLQQLKKYNRVKQTTKKTVFFWKLVR